MSSLSTSIKNGEQSPDFCQPYSPVARLIRITEQGLIFEGKKRFEVGTFIDLGLHVPARKIDAPGSAQSKSKSDSQPQSQPQSQSCFLSLEGFIVDCQVMSAAHAECSYQVTVMFSTLDADDRSLLRSLAELLASRPGEATTRDRREKLLRELEAALGLN